MNYEKIITNGESLFLMERLLSSLSYPISIKSFSAALRLASFLFGPLPNVECCPTET